MNILGLDFETQCTDAKLTNITEIGAVSVEWEPGKGFSREVSYSSLVYDESYPPQSDTVVELTGITDDLLKLTGSDPVTALDGLMPMVEKADIILAHNAVFDRNVLEASVIKHLGEDFRKFFDKEWLCTYTDIDYAPKFRCKQLPHLALDHGLKMDGRELHRAIDDVKLMLELVTTKYDFEEVLKFARIPWVYVRADILGPWVGNGGDGGVGKEQATGRGYGWECARGTYEPKFPKKWVKRVKQDRVEQEMIDAPFRVIRLEE
jgi:hypothetical protein